MGKKSTREEIERRLDIVEDAMATRVWRSHVERELGREFGVTRRQIRRYRDAVLRRLARGQPGPDERRAMFLQRLHAAQEGAHADAKWGQLAGLLKVEAEVCGYEAPKRVEVEQGAEVRFAFPLPPRSD